MGLFNNKEANTVNTNLTGEVQETPQIDYEAERQKKIDKELNALPKVIGIIMVIFMIIIIMLVLIIITQNKNSNRKAELDNSTNESIWGNNNKTEINIYPDINKDDLDEDNKKLYLGDYESLQQFYTILGTSYGTESTSGGHQMSKNKDYLEDGGDKIKVVEIYLKQVSLEFYNKNGAFMNGIRALDSSRIVWSVKKDKLNEYLMKFYDIKLNDEGFQTYKNENNVTGYDVEDDELVFATPATLRTPTYIPVITNKYKLDDGSTKVEIELVSIEKVEKQDKSLLFKCGDCLVVKKGSYDKSCVLNKVYLTIKPRTDGSYKLISLKF